MAGNAGAQPGGYPPAMARHVYAERGDGGSLAVVPRLPGRGKRSRVYAPLPLAEKEVGGLDTRISIHFRPRGSRDPD